MTALLFY